MNFFFTVVIGAGGISGGAGVFDIAIMVVVDTGGVGAFVCGVRSIVGGTLFHGIFDVNIVSSVILLLIIVWGCRYAGR